MWAFGLDFESRTARELTLPDPRPPGWGEVLLRVEEAGVCGTDRELAAFRLGRPPEGELALAIGHEAVCRVLETGPGATRFAPGDWVVPSVRRTCSPACASCSRGRRDLCVSGGYLERGIFGLHGYCAEFAIDRESDLTPIPAGLADLAVLVEPLSIVEKAIASALRIHEPEAETGLVIGAGPVGLLAAMTLRLRGLRVAVHSLEPRGHPRARAVEHCGIEYHSARPPLADIVIEAAGTVQAGLLAIRSMRPLGVCAILGAPNASGPVPFMDLIVANQTVFGSVNASPADFERAVADLALFPSALLSGWIHRTGRNALSFTLLGEAGRYLKVVHRIGE